MKIIFFDGVPCRNGEPLEFKGRGSNACTWSYFLRDEFHRRGIETDMFGGSTLIKTPENIPEGDHVLSVSQRGFTTYMQKYDIPDIQERLKAKIKGKITTICDSNLYKGETVEDITFFCRPGENSAKQIYVGWAASPEWLYPEKSKVALILLIDHTLYHDGEDDSASIISQSFKFQQEYGGQSIVKRFVSGGVEWIRSENQTPAVYDRKGMPYPECVKEYNRADVFFVTHRESMGLSVLESAMAGALIVSPRGYIKKELIHDLNHYEHDGVIDWSVVLDKMDPAKSRQCALKYNWSSVADKMLEYFNQ